jgi:hypothetical protein
MKALLLIAALVLQGAPIQVSGGVQTAGVTVSGRAILPPGQPMTVIQRVMLVNPNGTNSTTIKPDGSFEFSKVLPGSYSLFTVASSSSGIQALPVSLLVVDKDVSGIELVLVAAFNVTGAVVVEGDGLRPRLVLSFFSRKGGTTPTTGLSSPDASFRVTLPEGEYRIGWTGLPAGYELKSVMAGSTDLLANPLKVSPAASVPSITVTLAVPSPPWVKVSGRVTGLSGPFRVSLSGTPVVDTLETPLNRDGSFEFPRVLPGSYTARLTPALPIPAVQVMVLNKDLNGVEIAVPPVREVIGNVVINGLIPVSPQLSFTFLDVNRASPTASTSAVAVAEPDGKFRVMMPQGERRVTLSAPGFTVRSLKYGETDLLKDPLKLSSSDSSELRVELGAAGIPGGVIGGVPGNVVLPTAVPQIITRKIDEPSPASPTPPPPSVPPPPPPRSGLPRVSQTVLQGSLISRPDLKYPDPARAARVQGAVEAVIGKDGHVVQTRIIAGNPLLSQEALDNVKQWVYKPYIQNGSPTEIVTTITVNFAFQ